jgi:drug/metabolite transporter (DMT)-like permease
MNATAVTLVLLSAFLHALTSLLTKRSREKQVFLWCYQCLGLIIFAPLFIWFLWKDCPELGATIKWGLITGAIHFFYVFFAAKSYHHADLSLVYPIMRSSPALVLVCAVIFLNEAISLQGATGIIFVAFGVYIINMDSLSVANLIKPFSTLFTQPGSRFALLTMLAVTGYTLADKIAVREINAIVYSYLVPASTMLLFTPYILWTGRGKLIAGEWMHHRRSIFVNAITSQGGYLLILVAFTVEEVSYVAGFRQLSIVFAVLMGGHFLKEGNFRARLTAATVICAGAFLIATA